MANFVIYARKQRNFMRLIFVYFLMNICFVHSQMHTSNQQWVQYYTQFEFNSKYSLLSDAGYRWQNKFQHNNLYIARIGVAYTFNPKFRFAIGFAHLGIFNSDKLTKMEFRPYQEIQYKKKHEEIKVELRFRLEERIFNNYIPNYLVQPSTFNLRYRYQFLINIPIWRFSKKKTEQLLSLGISDEVFFKTDKGSLFSFEQNRVVLSPTIHFNNRLSISLNYNAQVGKYSEADDYIYSSVFWLTIRQQFTYRK